MRIRTLSVLTMASMGFSLQCGSSTSDGPASSTDGGEAGSADAEVDGNGDAADGSADAGADGNGDAAVDGNGDAAVDAACGAIENRVPVSCEPFPVSTLCDPFGTWALSYDVEYPGMCVSAGTGPLVVERGSDGIVRVGFGFTKWATLSEDGCELSAESRFDWKNPSENGSIVYTLQLSFAGGDAGADAGAATAEGELEYNESGFCYGTGKTAAHALKVEF